MIPPETIAEHARHIAQVLGVRSTRQRLPGSIRDQFHRTLAVAAESRAEPLYDKLLRIRQNIHTAHKRDFWTCLILLDRLWLLPPGTPGEKDVARLIKESYHLCNSPEFKVALRDELLDKQWSSFPVVRKIASEIREIELVDVAEANHLADERTFPDIRIAIAQRLLLHRQHEHFERLLAYLIWFVETDGEDKEERRHAESMFLRLRDFGFSVVVTPVYQAYIQHYEDRKVRGFLLRTLSALGDELVPQLEDVYRAEARHSERRPIIRLLRQLLGYGSPSAARALGDLVRTEQAEHLAYAAEQLVHGAEVQALHDMESGGTVAIRDHLDELGRQLASSDQPVHRHLCAQLAQLTWDAAVTQGLVERVVTRTATHKERHRLRLGGRRVAELLSEVIRDERRATRERVAATQFLPQIFGQRRRPGPETLLWRLYSHTPEEELRLTALECLAQLELPPPTPDARQILFDDFQRGNSTQRQRIEQCWNRLFPEVPPLRRL